MPYIPIVKTKGFTAAYGNNCQLDIQYKKLTIKKTTFAEWFFY